MIQSLKRKIKLMALTVSSVLLLAACSAAPSADVNYYRLPHLNQPSTGYCDGQARQIAIDAVIGRDGVMVQETELLMVEARNNRWVGGLASQLQNSLQRQLTDRCEHRLQVSLMQFYGNTQGEAVVAGYWHFNDGSKAGLRGAFEQRVSLNNDGYAGLVRALDRAWLKSLNNIEQQIKN